VVLTTKKNINLGLPNIVFLLYLVEDIGPCHVSGIPLQKGFFPFAKEKNRAAWLESD
jgi:hypothetical protein